MLAAAQDAAGAVFVCVLAAVHEQGGSRWSHTHDTCPWPCCCCHCAGADVLFEDPEQRSTSVGVTVSPVRVANIGQFGDLQAVGQRLLDAERKKVIVDELHALTHTQSGAGAA